MAASRPYVLGLTGSIGMGKSTVASFFSEEGVPIFSADQAVHSLYAAGGAAVELVEAAFPGTCVNGAVDRGRLSIAVLGNQEAFKKLESIVHPLVEDARQKFISQNASRGARLVVLDIPLLFETGLNGGMDAVLVVSAPEDIQRERVLARPGMTLEKLDAILAKQVPDSVKRQKADFIIDTGTSLDGTRAEVKKLITQLHMPPSQ